MDREGTTSEFGGLLRRHRRAAGLSQEALAERAGLSVRGLSDLERGLRRRPHAATVRLLARALRLDPDESAALDAAGRAAGPVRGAAARRSAPTAPINTNLPVLVSSFVGRSPELAEIGALLRGARLVTLTGPAGVGKTRLALEAAHAAEAYPDGVWLIELAALTDPDLVPPAVAVALGVPETGARPLTERLRDHVRARRLLLVLDNCEHVLRAVAPLVAGLLAVAPGLRVLATGRGPLRVSGEREFPVAPLGLPESDGRGRPPDPTAVAQAAAVALFVQRAASARPDFRLTPQNAGAVAAICRRLDGLPLAIELAAARVRLLPPGALLARLGGDADAPRGRLQLLTNGARDVPARHRTLRDAIAWSERQLAPAEQALFARLSVFAGGFALQAAEAVCGVRGDFPLEVLDGLASLVEWSLVRLVDVRDESDAAGDEPRFGMLETVGEYARERLAARPEAAAVGERHAAHYAALAAQAGPELQGPQRTVWLARLERELDNIRSVLRRAEDRGEPELGLRVAAALEWFWVTRHRTEGRDHLTRLLAFTAAIPVATLGAALCVAGRLSWQLGDLDDAHRRMDEAVRLARGAGDPRLLSRAVWGLGYVALLRGDDATARPLLEEGVALAEREGDPRRVAGATAVLARLACRRGDAVAAQAIAERGLALARAARSPLLAGHHMLVLAQVAYSRGDRAAASALAGESADRFRDADAPGAIAQALRFLADVARTSDDYRTAAQRYQDSLRLFHGLGEQQEVAATLARIAASAGQRGEWRRAARLAGAASAAWDAIHTGRPPAWPPTLRGDADAPARTREAACAAVGDLAAAAWSAGRAMSLTEALAEALAPVRPAAAPAAGAGRGSPAGSPIGAGN
jgi:non-specific serine/threonine protein kinase